MDFAYKTCVILSALLLTRCRGQSVSQSSVGFSLKISPDSEDQQFKIGANRVLRCSASATDDNQKPSLYWEVKGVQITSTTDRIRVEILRADNGLMLRVDAAQDGDEGMYRCVATLGSQTDSRSIRVQIIQDLTMNSPLSQFGIYGEDGEVKCDAKAIPPPFMSWKQIDGINIESSTKYIIQQNGLLIKNLDDSDSRVYLCDVVVMETGISMTYHIDFQVVRLPKIEMIPIISPNNPKEGDSEVRITCQATGFPQPTYHFMKGENLITEDKVDEINGILTLHDLRREDEAVYTCVATNRGGSDQKSNRLDVKIPPTIFDIPDVKDAVEDGQVKFTCTAQGDPAPILVWQKLGYPAYNDGIRDSGPEIINVIGNDREDAEIKTVGKIMSFNPIKSQDVGTYMCTAINVVGNATKTVKFEVQYKPTFDTDFKESIFFGWKGHPANLTCVASANDLAVIQWFELREGQITRIENESPYTLATPQQWPDYHLTSSTLMVYVSDDDSPVFKDYICEAVNSMGKANRTVTLRRALPPNPPIVRVPNVLPTKVTLEVHAPAETGGLPVIGYRCTYYQESDMSSKVDKDIDSKLEVTIVELKDLRANTAYILKTSARNAAGLGQEVSVSFQTKEVSKPQKMDITSDAVGSESTSYTLTWADPDDGGSSITQYLIRYRAVIVTGVNPSQWVISGDIESSYTDQTISNPSARSYTLRNLNRNSYYDVRIVAVNKEGKSPEVFKIIKTSQGAGAGTDGNSASLTVNVTSTLLLLILACLSAPW